MMDKYKRVAKITQETLIPLGSVGMLVMATSIFISDHIQVKALGEQARAADISKAEQNKILTRLDKKVTLLMFKFRVHLDDRE